MHGKRERKEKSMCNELGATVQRESDKGTGGNRKKGGCAIRKTGMRYKGDPAVEINNEKKTTSAWEVGVKCSEK